MTTAQTTASDTSLRFLLLGDVGVGKSAFIDTFVSTLSNVQSNEMLEEFIPLPKTSYSASASTSQSSIRLPAIRVQTAPTLQEHQDAQHTQLHDPLGLLPHKVEVPAREVTFVTLPGYSSTLNPSTVLSMTDDYLNHHLHTTNAVFSPTISSAQLAWFLITGSGIHSLPTCAFYFVLYELKPVDILYMKLIHERVNLVPIITKADTLSQKELWVLKKRMIRQLKLNGVNFHTFGMDLATVEEMAEQRQWGAAPFVVSTRRDQGGDLFRSELESLVNMCLYKRFRQSQEDATHKVIAWRKAFGPSEVPATTAAEKIWGERAIAHGLSETLPADARPTDLQQTTSPPLEAQLMSQYADHSANGFTPPPPQNHVVVPTNYVPALPPSSTGFNNVFGTSISYSGMASSTNLTPGAALASIASPKPSILNSTSAYVPTTAYSPPPRSPTANSATQARLTLIHQSTGMAVDSSTRPNEIMDENNVNTVHTQAQGLFMESYFTPLPGTGDNSIVSPNISDQGSEVKVEVPNSVSSYQVSQASATQTLIDLGIEPQNHGSFILPNTYQSPGAFFIPPSDLYQATILSTGTGEILPDIWEAVELGDLATVKRHLISGVSPDQRNSSRSTLLHRTAWQGSKPFAVMHLLISYGANVNLTNENGNTVLQNVLMKHDDPSLVKLLLDNGAESTIPNKEGMNTLEVAALFNKIESARYLLENDLSSSEPESVLNALQRARSPDKKAIKTLLKSWQGKEGEIKRVELTKRLRGQDLHTHHTNQSQVHIYERSLSQLQNQSQTLIPDAASVHSFDTNKGGDGNAGSSKASSLNHEGHELGPSTGSSSTTSSNQGNQAKHMSRFNLKTMRAAAPSMTNLFNRK